MGSCIRWLRTFCLSLSVTDRTTLTHTHSLSSSHPLVLSSSRLHLSLFSHSFSCHTRSRLLLTHSSAVCLFSRTFPTTHTPPSSRIAYWIQTHAFIVSPTVPWRIWTLFAFLVRIVSCVFKVHRRHSSPFHWLAHSHPHHCRFAETLTRAFCLLPCPSFKYLPNPTGILPLLCLTRYLRLT